MGDATEMSGPSGFALLDPTYFLAVQGALLA